MSDADLLELALHPRGGDLMGTLSPSQTTAIADRLTDMGFPRLAMAALARIEVASSPDARRSRARAALADGDAAQALALVAGEESPGAARLRGTALSQLGSHALAAAAFAAAGDTGRAAQEAWLSGDSEAIARFGTEEQRGLAASLLPRVDAAAAPLPVPSAAGPGALRPGPDRAPPGATPVGEGADASRQAASGDGGPPLGVERPDAARLPTDGGPPSLSAARSLVDDSSALRESLQQLLGERAGAP
jgi:hypothetical protein